MELKTFIMQFKNDYTKLLNDFSIIDENDPLTKDKLSNLLEALNSFMEIIKESFSKHKKYFETADKANSQALIKYNNEIATLNKNLTDKLAAIAESHEEKIKNLELKIHDSKQKNNYNNEQAQLDYQFFLATSEQNKEVLQNDNSEAKKRFKYERDAAKESYLEIVNKYNLELNAVKVSLTSEYETSGKDYVVEHDNIISNLKSQIATKEAELSQVAKALETSRNEMKEHLRLESARQNEEIKKVAAERNKTIDAARNQYTKIINNFEIEKENNHQEYQNKSQELLKEFITKISIIDEETNEKKNSLDSAQNNLKREYYSIVYDKTKIFHKQLENIYTASATSTVDRYTKSLIKFKNRLYIKDINKLKKDYALKITRLNQAYTKDYQSNKTAKSFLEIDKDFALKMLADNEKYDVKVFQQKSDIYENDLNRELRKANFDYDKKVNNIRTESQNRVKLIEKDYQKIEIEFYKDMEVIKKEIENLQLEVSFAQIMNDLVTEREKESYISKLHFEEVINLLEIEKNKILKKYNEQCYEYNIRKLNSSKDYGLSKIALENERALKEKDLNIELNEVQLEKNNASTSFAIKKEQLEERFLNLKTKLIYNNDLKSSKENYIIKLKNNSIVYLTQIINSFTYFYDSYRQMYTSVIDIILKDIEPNEDNYHYLESFIDSISQYFIKLFEDILTDLYDKICQKINEKLDFIYDFKYRSSLELLDTRYQSSIESIKLKKNEIVDKIDGATKTVENLKQKIYTMVNDIELSKHSKRHLSAAETKEIKENELKVKEYREKIENYIKTNKLYNENLNELNTTMAKMKAEHRKEYEGLQKSLEADQKIYSVFKQKVIVYYNRTLHSAKQIEKEILETAANENMFIKTLTSCQTHIGSLINSAKSELNRIFEDFVYATKVEEESIRKQNTKEFQIQKESYQKKYTKASKQYLNEYHKAITELDNKLNRQEAKMQKVLAAVDNKINLNNKRYFINSNNLSAMFKNTTANFFKSCAALQSNDNAIICNYNKEQSQINNKFNKAKEKTILDNLLAKRRLDEDLKAFRIAKNLEIEHLPELYRYNAKAINEENRKNIKKIHEDMRAARIEYLTKNREIQHELEKLKAQLAIEKALNETQQHKGIKTEKHNYPKNLKKAIANIKIVL